ncbi:MAG: SDR family oxidoreductase [Actinobacteria bacterium]|jgi:3-hydroxybutyrate dehydrogenase|nr:SDR family oxidoreductase [Actinomycetota bacterium]NBP53901.1 SDR family oxidoreductase [Actinomycetota bacterium]
MSIDLTGQTALITGGTRGIGRAIAHALLGAGAKVAVSGRNAAKAEELNERWAATGRLCVLEGDVMSKDGMESMIDATEKHFGPLDICVLNAGGVNNTAPIVEMTDEEWQYELDINLNHTFWGTRRALRTMLPRRSGRIICLSSVEGKHGKPRIAGYAANKHAINGFVKGVSREVGHEGVIVVSLCPGIVVTDALLEKAGKGLGLGGVDEVIQLYTQNSAIKRAVTLDEIGEFTLFLCGPHGAAFAGGTVSLDGGEAFY